MFGRALIAAFSSWENYSAVRCSTKALAPSRDQGKPRLFLTLSDRRQQPPAGAQRVGDGGAGRLRDGCVAVPPAQPPPALCTQPLKPFPSGGLLSVLQPCCAVWYEFAGIKFRRRLLRGGRGEPGSSWEASPAPAREAAASSRRMRVCLQLCQAFCRTGPAKLHTTFFFFFGGECPVFFFFPVLF